MGLFSEIAAKVADEAASHHEAADQARALSFRPWAEQGEFKADRERINFKLWRFLKPIYDCVPDTCSALRRPEQDGFKMVIMKAAQCGASTLLMLWTLWMALRREMRLAYFMPVKEIALEFSTDRFIRMIRDNPPIHRLMGDRGSVTIFDPKDRSAADEGSAATRRILDSIVYFSYLQGVVTTEGKPLDALGFDEVQKMSLADIERTSERVSASQIKAQMHVSTAYFEESDIHALYLKSDQREFHTRCGCEDGCVMADHVDARQGPLCIDISPVESRPSATPKERHYYVCPKCRTVIMDPQDGLFVPHRRDNFRMLADGFTEGRIGWSFPQFLSPRLTPYDLLQAWLDRVDTQNYFNRKVGRPFNDPNAIPVSLPMLIAAQNPSLAWGPPKRRGEGIEACYMGIDQMGHDNHVVIVGKTNNPNRPMRLLHLEIILEEDPWQRCAELMREYRVRYCAVEQAPNFNDAQKFAKAFDGKVFLINYAEHANEILTWGDRPKDQVLVRQTDEELRTRYTASVDQYKMMDWSLSLWDVKAHYVETPDARGLTQHVRGTAGQTMVCKDVFWRHLMRIALVTELKTVDGKQDERKYRRAVKKLGSEDPHFAYAWLSVCVAWARAYGVDQMLLPDEPVTNQAEPEAMNTTPVGQVQERLGHLFQPPVQLASLDPDAAAIANCGTCVNFMKEKQFCRHYKFTVQASMPPCAYYVPVEEDDEDDWEE